ncbi:hypothetical protein QF035_009021 [Streptomyces umbrinus]|uniref:Uncharacterized protein n=1 Tax=Streptomyces umbrinus TaxID=67370 RepID=A0ABU0T6K2_9ACTN|nr:hypothetical protein [Streptomyces umbrinus]MDQ1031439.1 hypothetical protein [Streptomyces umbrinus]
MTQGAMEPVLASKADQTKHGITPAELVGPRGGPGRHHRAEALPLLTPMAKEIELCTS